MTTTAATCKPWIFVALHRVSECIARADVWLAWLLVTFAARAVDHARRVGCVLWAWCRPWLADVGGWLRYSAPRLLGLWLRRKLSALGHWLPGALWRLIRYTLTGAWWSVSRAARFMLAYNDFADVIAEARSLGKPRRAKSLTEQWRRAILRRTIGVLVFALVLGVIVGRLIAVYDGLGRLAVFTVAVAILAGIGRAVRPLPPSDAPGEDAPPADPDAPFPLADAHTRAEVAECVRRAVTAENITLRRVEETSRQLWGWTAPIVLASGTPADLVGKLGNLETTLDLPAGGVLATPDSARRARVVLRLITGDPFATMAAIPDYAPGSLSILDAHTIGARMDGKPLMLRLVGAHAVIIGSPGSGKSMLLRVIADIVTACRDAICWDLTPAGVGLDAFGPVISRRERSSAGIENALETAISYATVRPSLAAELGMGDEWQPSAAGPALVVVIDEYPRLTARAKELAGALLDIGRKTRITLVLAATEATSDSLGRAIADSTAIRVMLPSRHADVRLVFGPRMIAEGWRPDRLHPAIDDDLVEDAGRCYISAPGIREPILCKITPLSSAQAHQRGHERMSAGLPCLDEATVGRAAALDNIRATQEEYAVRVVDHEAVAAIIAAFGDDSRLWTEDLLSRLAGIGERYRGWAGADLAAILRPLGITPVQIRKGKINRRGYEKSVIDYARRAVLP